MKDKIKLTIKDEGIFFLSSSRDGMIFGLNLPDMGSIHLTIMYKDGRFSSHITDQTREKPPWGQQFDPDFILKDIEKYLEKWKRKYHGNKKCWILKDKYRKEIESDLIVEKESNIIPMDKIVGKTEFNLNDKERWKRVKIRDILYQDEIALIKDDNVLRWIIPIDENIMLAFSEKQFENAFDDILGRFGLEEFFEYTKDKVGKEDLEKKIKDKLSSLE